MRLCGARRGLVRSARALAAAALLALSGTLALPATAEAQTETTLVSNIGQGSGLRLSVAEYAQRFTTGSNASGYTLTGVDVPVGATSTAFTARLCETDTNGHPTSTCTVLTAPSSVSAAGTASFTAPDNTTLMGGTTYTVKLSITGGFGFTTANDEDAGGLAGWSIADAYESYNTFTNSWSTTSSGRSVRMAIKGHAAGGGTPTCTLNTGDLWCGVVTVADIDSGGSVAAHGFAGTDGDLDDKTFSVGTNNYTIDGLYVGTAGDLNLDLTGALDAADKGNLELVVGSAAFDLDDATDVPSVNGYLWLTTGLDWSSETYVTLRLRRKVALSTDATLSGLTVYDGSSNLTLSPTFASGTEAYTASAAYDIATVTVTASKNQADATIAWLDASDVTLADADAMAAGRQVALEAGGNTLFKVKVTAEDGTTTKTYTVTVNRANPSCTPNAGELWCGVVTVGNDLISDGYLQAFSVGALSDRTFSVGSNNYTIDTIAVINSGLDVGEISFSLTSALSAGDRAKLVVHVGSVALKFSEASFTDVSKSYEFASTGLDWSSESFVELRLRDTPVTNNAPVFSPTSTTRTVAENSAAGTNVGAVIPEATDADSGDTLTYSMAGTDATSFAFDASTRQITTITGVTYNHEATKNSYSVTVKADDDNGGTATVDVTIDVTDVNEKSAKPDKPTLAKVTGSSTTLTATWTKPDLDGGPAIAGYDLQYREGTTGTWEDFTHTGTAVTTTITGLTADTSYQVQVRAKNGETDSDWSDPSDAVKTNATAPTISAVAVTSTPVLETDTYGAGETIEVSVTFDEAVTATSDTDFELNVSGDRSAPLVRGSGTATLVFGYTVVSSDEDDDGIWIGDQDRTLVGARRLMAQSGTITSVATSTAADLTHAELGQQSGHKVDGSRSIVSVAVSSTPMLETDTYGAGETIRFTVTFNLAVDVSGDPVLAFALGNQGDVRDVDAAHESGTGTTALVFAYTVVSTDEDNNGIFLRDENDFNNPDGPVRLDSDDTIQFTGTSTDVPLYWQGRGTQSGHKVDGSRTTGNNAPVFDPATATRTVAENSAAGTNVGAVIPEATDADNDTLAYSMAGTDAASFDFNASTRQITTITGVDYDFEATQNTYEVTVKADDDNGGTATVDVTIDVTDVNEKSAKPDKPTLAKVTGSSTTLTATWTEPDLDGGPAIAGYDLQYREGTTGMWEDFAHTGAAVTTTITGLTADTSYQVQVRAKNGETDSDWSDASDAVKTNAAGMTPSCTLNPDDLWCGVVTVGARVVGGNVGGYGFASSLNFGGLTDDSGDTSFNYGTETYTVTRVEVNRQGGLIVRVRRSSDSNFVLHPDHRAQLVLHIAGSSDAFAFSGAQPHSALGYTWAGTGLDWSSATYVTLRLRLREDLAAIDATLRALSVTHAGGTVALRPVFAPGATEYRASVANAVDEVTATATATVAGATVRYLDASDTAIPDTDTGTPGREVALEVGQTVVQVEVRATDRTTMRTYRVTVTRRGVDAAGVEGELRLTDEEPYADPDNDRYGGTAGRVEVSHAGAWGTVCSDGIRRSTVSLLDYDPTTGDLVMDSDGNPTETVNDNEAAALICRDGGYDTGEYHMKYSKFRPGLAEADHQDADYWPPHSSYPPGGPTPIWLDDLRCVAGESALGTDPLPGAMSHCSYAGWGLHNCTHKEDAVVRCWNNDPGGAGLKSLKGRFVSPPERHDGTNRVKVRVAFSEPVEESPENVGAHGVEVEGGEVTSVSPVGGDAPDGAGTRSAGGRNAGREDREVVWEFEIEPDSDGDLTVTLEAGRPCDEPGAICTADGRALSEGISTTVEGPEAGPPPLTASFEDMPEAHDGAGAFRFRVAFSENIGISYRSLREDAFAVTGGRVTRGKRVDRRRDLFEVTVRPDSAGDVTIVLPAGRECAVSGAICTRGEPRRQLTNTLSATVAGPAVESGAAGLTARFARVPSEHDGTTAFKLRIAFSETIRMSGRRLRSDVVAVSGGRATRAGRVNRRKDLWKLKVRPDSLADVTVTLAAGAACDSPGAVCTKGEPRRRLTNTISATVRGPVAVSVADARAREGEDETIDFAVSLSRAASGPVSVTWATADGTATAGSDYTRASGKLRFAPGETEKTISVPVLDDAHDEGEETMQLRLSAASGAAIADGVATGTIENSDPMPHAWLSRFGRTLAGQVVDALGRRMEGGAGTHVRVGGMQFDASGAFVEAGDEDEPRLATDTIGWTDPAHASSGMTGRELLLGSSFALGAGGANGTPAWTGWGRFATHGFEADVDGTRLDGNVTTGFVGADMARDGWLAGIALSYSTGDGDFSLIEGDDEGSVENSLTALYPYAKLGLGEKVDVWGLAGLGSGDLTLTLEADAHRATEERYTTDIDMRMGALGVRGEVVSPKAPGGFAVNVKSDAFWVRMDSDAVASEDGNLHASQTDASRVRLVLEGSRAVELDEGTLTPSLELGLRHDGGDAETGTGLEAGAGLRYAAGALTIGAQVRTLVAHEASGYEEWGVSGSVRLDPGASGRGLSLKLAPVFGAPSSGVEHLWSARDAGGLVGTEDFEAGRRLEAELGYGIGLSGTRGLLTPYTALSWRQDGARTHHRTGARWQLARAAALGLEWTHEPGTGAKPPANALMLRTQVRW